MIDIEHVAASAKSKWRSWTIWWGNFLMALGGIDLLMHALDNASMLSPYMGKWGSAVLFACGLINQALRFKTRQAIK